MPAQVLIHARILPDLKIGDCVGFLERAKTQALCFQLGKWREREVYWLHATLYPVGLVVQYNSHESWQVITDRQESHSTQPDDNSTQPVDNVGFSSSLKYWPYESLRNVQSEGSHFLCQSFISDVDDHWTGTHI